MAPSLTEDEVDDLLYFARTGESQEFEALMNDLCKRQDANILELVEAARDPESGNGVLHMAAANGYTDLLRTICKELASKGGVQSSVVLGILNAQNKAGNTALHWAALNGHLDPVMLLLEQGADPTITNARGHDAIYEAELNDKNEIVEWILKEGSGLQSTIGDDAGEGQDEDEDMEGEGEGSGSGINVEEMQKKLREEMESMNLQPGGERR